MPVFRLDDRLVFPPVHLAEDGLLALGGDLRPERLLLGYTQGIFPWYAENLPILWHSPDPRMVMTTKDLVIQRSLKKAIRRAPYELRMDSAPRGRPCVHRMRGPTLVSKRWPRYSSTGCGCGGMVDAGDLKSPGPCPCRFESGHPHQHFPKSNGKLPCALLPRSGKAIRWWRFARLRPIAALAPAIAGTAERGTSDG